MISAYLFTLQLELNLSKFPNYYWMNKKGCCELWFMHIIPTVILHFFYVIFRRGERYSSIINLAIEARCCTQTC